LRDLTAVRSQIDYHLFITKLLKEEHKQVLGTSSETELLKLKQSGIHDQIDL